MREPGRSSLLVLVVAALVTFVSAADAATRPHVVVVAPYEVGGLPPDERWIGDGIREIVALALAQHPAFVVLDRPRVAAVNRADARDEPSVVQAARAVRADVALFGSVARRGEDLVIEPRLLELRGATTERAALEPLRLAPDQVLARAHALPFAYARRLRVAVSEAERARMEKAARPTPSPRAFELFSRGQAMAAQGDQEGRESAANLLGRAIEEDPSFVVAQYVLGSVYQSLGNRWKAAAQYRAATQIDPSYPEPFKALGDLFLSAPRRLFDQAVEAYSKAIELRPTYADAYAGLGDAKAAKGDLDGAIAAYQKALAQNAANPRVQISLGKIYYTEKGLYYEAVSAYKRAIELDPQSVEAHMGLGDVYEDKGLYKEAVSQYQRALDLEPKSTAALYSLAQVYEKVDPREAITLWERYIATASQIQSEKDWVDVARQHLRKLKSQIKD